MSDYELIQLARNARKNAYSPYSGYTVGAALLCDDGSVVTGCNVENASYGATICAERVAMTRAVAEGKLSFTAIAVVGGRKDEMETSFFSPCGICRQFMREFCGDSFRILVACGEEIRSYSLKDLLPDGFSAEDMKEN